MDSKILLGKILQRFSDKQNAKVEGYNSFGYVRETNNSVVVTREAGKDTPVPFSKILKGIDAYKSDSKLYNAKPSSIREFGVTHVTSPVWSLLHLLKEQDYK